MSKAGDFAKSKMGGKAGDKVKEGSVKVQYENPASESGYATKWILPADAKRVIRLQPLSAEQEKGAAQRMILRGLAQDGEGGPGEGEGPGERGRGAARAMGAPVRPVRS